MKMYLFERFKIDILGTSQGRLFGMPWGSDVFPRLPEYTTPNFKVFHAIVGSKIIQ